MSDERIALADLCDTFAATDAGFATPEFLRTVARLLRESAQREAALEDAKGLLIAAGGRPPFTVVYSADDAERLSLDSPEADAFKRGVEAAAKACDAEVEHIREDERRAESRIVNNPRAVERRGQSVELPLVRAAAEIAVQRMVAERCAAAIRALLPPAPAAPETHEFVPSHVGADYCLHAFDAQRLCGERRSHPIHRWRR